MEQLGKVYRHRAPAETSFFGGTVQVHQNQSISFAIGADENIPAVQIVMQRAAGVHLADQLSQFCCNFSDISSPGLAVR